MNTKFVASAVVILLGCLVAPACWAQSGSHIIVTPNDLKWSDVPSLPAGAKLAVVEGSMTEAVPFTVRLKLPAGYQIPAHWHPAVERVTVLSGTLNLGMGEKLDPTKTTALVAGSVAVMQPKTNHFVWTKEETVVQLNGTGPWGITYLNPADDPRKK